MHCRFAVTKWILVTLLSLEEIRNVVSHLENNTISDDEIGVLVLTVSVSGQTEYIDRLGAFSN